jgi:c-di-GMP-binding flagellar brake protein YcgR
MEKTYQGQERRKFERVEVNFVVTYRVNSPLSVRMLVKDQEIVAIAVNLSEGGIAISTNYQLSVSTLARIKFILVNEKALSISEHTKSMEALGEVRHSFLGLNKVYQIGVCFLDLSEPERQFIANFVKLEKKPLTLV